MVTDRDGDLRMSRRRFGSAVLGGAAVAVVGARLVVRNGDGGGVAVRSFDVVHDDSVYVTMSSGSEFLVQVKEAGTREVLERHERVTAHSLLTLPSDRVTFVDRR